MAAGAVLLAACTGGSGSGAEPSIDRLPGQVVVAGRSPDGGPPQLYLVSADGSGSRRLVRSDDADVHPSLSPDGRRVLFTRQRAGMPDRVLVVGADGAGLAPVVLPGCPAQATCSDSVEGPAWSPDGRRLVFTRAVTPAGAERPATVTLWTAGVDGADAAPLTQRPSDVPDVAPAQDRSAAWSPDGSRVAFVREHLGYPDQYAVLSVAADGSDLRQVSPNDIQAGEPAWSPDGSLIAFQSPPDDFLGVPKRLYTIRPDGRGMTPLTQDLAGPDADSPAWSPDGARLLFAHVPAGRTEGADLYLVNRDGSGLRRLAATSLSEQTPSWGVAVTATTG